jgi:hypothetical protein
MVDVGKNGHIGESGHLSLLEMESSDLSRGVHLSLLEMEISDSSRGGHLSLLENI